MLKITKSDQKLVILCEIVAKFWNFGVEIMNLLSELVALGRIRCEICNYFRYYLFVYNIIASSSSFFNPTLSGLDFKC